MSEQAALRCSKALPQMAFATQIALCSNRK